MISSRLTQARFTGLQALKSNVKGSKSKIPRRQSLVYRQAALNVNAAAESEVEDNTAEAPAAAAPKRGGGKGRKPKPGPAPSMTIGDLVEGQEYPGAVVSVTDFGAFVNIGCDIDGLLHISQISNEFVKNVADAVSVGQDISVRVLTVDHDRKKFSLTAKTAVEGGSTEKTQKPRQARVKKERKAKPQIPVKAGDTVSGAITSVAPFGVFVDVGEGFQGMLHSSQMKLPEGVEDHLSHFKEGDVLEVRVGGINREKISLTQLTDDEIKAQKEIETKGLSTVVEVPEGSGPFAHVLAEAGISRDMFQSKPAKKDTATKEAKKEKTEAKAAAPEKKEEAAPAKEAKADAGGISAKLVKELRQASGAGMMDCKKALAECGGDVDAAKDFLRKKGLASADKKSGRIAAEGAIASYIHAGSRLGVLVEVNCETDFVARGEKFQELVNDLAMQIAACPDIAVVSTEDVSAEMLEKERAIEMEKEDLKSKPEEIREKIIQGRLDKIAKEMALLEQPFIKDTSKTVAEVIKASIAEIGENIQVRRFGRFNLGEGIEVEDKGDFAAEVEAQTSAMAAKAAEKKDDDKKEEKKEEAAPAVAVSAKLVKELRQASGAGMMDCKKALAECGGDVDAAKDFLRKKGLASADKKSGRVAAEGAIASYIHAGSRLGVLAEINCETDFVARGEKFQELVNDLAMQIAACPQITVVSTEDVSAEMLEKERAIEMEKEDLKSKPEEIREKIIQGRLDKIAKEMALLEQPFIKDTSKTVAEVIKASIAEIGENIQVRRFNRFVLGEGIEKKEEDFAAEVAAQTQGKA
ncbi:hypothetical protein M9435_003288 [Picochlorum sp. BPE23]|nr:hypothetical protein M9435_003288 [Picochlorum sp. BPE23]